MQDDHCVQIRGYPRRVGWGDGVANQLRLVLTGHAVTPSRIVTNRPISQLVVPIRSIVVLEARRKRSRATIDIDRW